MATVTFEVEYSGDMDTSNNTLDPGILGSTGSSNEDSLSLTMTIGDLKHHGK